ncbi:hypothetical protein [Parasitella parasitica]|uniref:Uncharacterized protein n=1 Tax=Parasitella parasitica TaxID=35722 RepID=A0A0B7NE76_9FUNG|nr:hypothetical protein [Parasitella parasitica]
MATFPHWINKKSTAAAATTTTTTSTLSPRQVANKAYSLAIKKLDKDDNRRRPHYTVRERLLLSHTMTKAENLLNKCTPCSNRRVLASEFDDDVITCPSTANIPPPPPIHTPQSSERPDILSSAPTVSSQILESTTALPSAEHMAVSIAVAAAVAYNSLVVTTANDNQQSSASFCRPMMIPSHSMASFKTIV